MAGHEGCQRCLGRTELCGGGMGYRPGKRACVEDSGLRIGGQPPETTTGASAGAGAEAGLECLQLPTTALSDAIAGGHQASQRHWGLMQKCQHRTEVGPCQARQQ